MTDQKPRIIKYQAHQRSEMNRANRRALDKDLKRLDKLKDIDLAFESAILEVDFDYGFLIGFFRGEFQKECERLEYLYDFRFFSLNPDFIDEKYGMPTEEYKGGGISIINKIRDFVNRFN